MRSLRILVGLSLAIAGSVAVGKTQSALPRDVHPDSRNRLPLIKRENLDARRQKVYDTAVSSPDGLPALVAIGLHGSGENIRWTSALGRNLTELAILTNARNHDQPYEWNLHEMEAVASGLDPAVIDVVRNRKPTTGLSDKQAVIIEAGREVFGNDRLSSQLYARALAVFGEKYLVDIIDLMSGYSGTALRLTVFNQHMPPGWRQALPLPFTMPDDIDKITMSRLVPYKPGPSINPMPLYSRTLSPEGTGPQQIGLHGGGAKSLEANVGRRLMALAILVTAREHDSQYEWTTNEPRALKDGLEPAIIDVVRNRRPVTGLGEKEAALIELGREAFQKHWVTPATYARAKQAYGEANLVDITGLMGQHAGDAAMLAAFDQQLPVGQKPLLPMP